MQDNNIMNNQKSQSAIFVKLQAKKHQNKKVVEWLKKENQYRQSVNVEHCAEHIGITSERGIDKIIQADFCRERICNICAWRRQSKFIAQMKPVMQILSKEYQFVFITLTIKNSTYDELNIAIDNLIHAFANFRKRDRIKKSFKGMVRSIELTYNHEEHTYHPHIHVLAAVNESYFADEELYLTHNLLIEMWKDCLAVSYDPYVHIEKITDNISAVQETLKYALKPSEYEESLSAFYYILKGRRLVSFTGVFAQIRKMLKLTDFDRNLLDDTKTDSKILNIYKFDSTGGCYRFYRTFKIKE